MMMNYAIYFFFVLRKAFTTDRLPRNVLVLEDRSKNLSRVLLDCLKEELWLPGEVLLNNDGVPLKSIYYVDETCTESEIATVFRDCQKFPNTVICFFPTISSAVGRIKHFF